MANFIVAAGPAGKLRIPVPHVDAVTDPYSFSLLRLLSWRFSYPITAASAQRRTSGVEVLINLSRQAMVP